MPTHLREFATALDLAVLLDRIEGLDYRRRSSSGVSAAPMHPLAWVAWARSFESVFSGGWLGLVRSSRSLRVGGVGSFVRVGLFAWVALARSFEGTFRDRRCTGALTKGWGASAVAQTRRLTGASPR